MVTLARFAWGVVAYNLAVILWGAYVRATGSGAGCGAHWPLCNGEVIPSAPSVEMLVEFSHRLTSGLALLSVFVLVAWTFRATSAGHPARRGVAWAAFFMLTEAGVGAALVLFRLVADNASMARAMFMSVHLANTFALIAFLTLTAWWLSGGKPVLVAGRRGRALWLAIGGVAIGLTGVSGAVAALGDTLFPSRSLAEALAAELSPTSHLLIRLRLLHPSVAVTVAVGLMAAGLFVGRAGPVATARGAGAPTDRRQAPRPFTGTGLGRLQDHRRWATTVAVLSLIQVVTGFANVLLLAPVWMQLLHLLLADLLWISFVLFAANWLAWPSALPTRTVPST